jgi:hypothetical protein
MLIFLFRAMVNLMRIEETKESDKEEVKGDGKPEASAEQKEAELTDDGWDAEHKRGIFLVAGFLTRLKHAIGVDESFKNPSTCSRTSSLSSQGPACSTWLA